MHKKSFPSARAVMGSTLFTSSGTKFYHMFNISLCGNTSVVCTNNVTYNMEGEVSTVSPGLLQKLLYKQNFRCFFVLQVFY